MDRRSNNYQRFFMNLEKRCGHVGDFLAERSLITRSRLENKSDPEIQVTDRGFQNNYHEYPILPPSNEAARCMRDGYFS